MRASGGFAVGKHKGSLLTGEQRKGWYLVCRGPDSRFVNSSIVQFVDSFSS